MPENDDQDSKTEEPTEKKLKDAREKGQVAASPEVALVVSLCGFTAYLMFSGNGFVVNLGTMLSGFFERAGEIEFQNVADASNFFQLVATQIALFMAPLCLILMAGGVLSSFMQNQPAVILSRIAPKASKLSLVKGWSRLFGKDGMVNFSKSVGKLLLCGAVVSFSLYTSLDGLLNGMFQASQSFFSYTSHMIQQLLVSVCLAMIVIAVADYVWSRHSWHEKLKMSRKEIADEHKQAEGDPILKARIRSVAKDRSRQRMMAAVPTATLIIANPTHIAIALRFDPAMDDAPVVVAKGQDLVAQKIKEIARERGVPIFEKVELARALNKVVHVDQIIPPQFYAAVAELITAIYDRTLKLRG